MSVCLCLDSSNAGGSRRFSVRCRVGGVEDLGMDCGSEPWLLLGSLLFQCRLEAGKWNLNLLEVRQLRSAQSLCNLINGAILYKGLSLSFSLWTIILYCV